MQKRTLPSAQLRAGISPKTLNEKDRTVELVWSTGYKGLRSEWGQKFYEELSLEPGHVDLSRLQSGAPLLAMHNSESLDAVIGSVASVSVRNGEGVALVKFASDDISERIYQKVKDGILNSVSVGYSVEQYTDVSDQDDELKTMRATRWTPHELSIVSIGFDPHAKVRTNTSIISECEIINRANDAHTGQTMDKNTDAIKAEQTRCLGITKAVRQAKLDNSLADELIEQGADITTANKRIFAELETRNKIEVPSVSNTVKVEVGQSNQDKQREHLITAIAHRMDNSIPLTKGAKFFAGRSLASCAEQYLGRSLQESDTNLCKRAMSTSDFPHILGEAVGRSAMNRYKLQAQTFPLWTSKGFVRDYREQSVIRGGDFSSLEARNEGGETKMGAHGEEFEKFRVKDYAKMHAYTSIAMANDDLGILSQVASEAGVAASRLESSLVYDILEENPLMSDGAELFHSTRGNIASAPGDINEASLDLACRAIETRRTVDGLDFLGTSAKFLICGPEQRVAAQKQLGLINASEVSKVNAFQNALTLVVDPRITGRKWFVSCSPDVCATIKLYLLESSNGPSVMNKVDFSTQSLLIRCEHTAAAKALDYRGMYFNAGE